MRTTCALFLAAAILTPSTSQSQMGTSTFVGYRTWTISLPTGDVDVSQMLVPFSVQVPLRPNLDLAIWDGGASSGLDNGDEGKDLAGLSSAAAQAFLRLADDRLLLQAGVTVPSGKRELDAEETDVLRIIGLPLLNFGLRHYGRGPEGNIGATVAVPWTQSTVVSLGTGFTMRGEYALFEDAEDYRQASEWAINTGLDWGNSDPELEGLFVRVGATFRMFGTDQLGGRDAFEEGDQLDLDLLARTGGAGVLWNGSIRTAFKADNTDLGPSGTVVSQLNVAPGSAVFVSGGGSIPLPRNLRAGLDLEWATVAGSDQTGWDGYTFGVGPTFDWNGERLGIRVRGSYLGGRLDGDGNDAHADAQGFATDVSLRWSWGY